MKTTSLLSIAAAASLTAFIASLVVTQDLVTGTAALAIAMAILTLIHEYTPRTHFVVTPRQSIGRKRNPQVSQSERDYSPSFVSRRETKAWVAV